MNSAERLARASEDKKELETLSLKCPIVHRALTLWRYEDASFEHALIIMVLALSKQKEQMSKMIATLSEQAIMGAPTPICTKCGKHL